MEGSKNLEVFPPGCSRTTKDDDVGPTKRYWYSLCEGRKYNLMESILL